MLEGAIQSATISPGRTHLQYRGCGPREKLQRQGALLSLWCCDTALSSAKGSKERFVWHSTYSDTPQKLDDKTWLKWEEFSSDHESVPPCTELLKFLDLKVRQLESVSQVGHKHASGSDRKMLSLKPSYTISTNHVCLACKKRGHQIHTCSVFKGWIWEDRISVVKELGLCNRCARNAQDTIIQLYLVA